MLDHGNRRLEVAIDAVRALTFDVFGTVVDWRSSVIRQCRAFGARHGVETDWESFVDAWRYDGYIGGILAVLSGELPFQTAGALHRRKLDALLIARGITGISEAEIAALNRAWHHLDPWPDAAAGLRRLRSKFVVSTLSNGEVALLVDLSRHAGLDWDCVLSAELTGAFKPARACYAAAARLLGLAPEQAMMVAAHKADLVAAQAAGFQAAFVPRPLEAGADRAVDLSPDPAFQIVATDFDDLANQLGCSRGPA
jgi:2-haloacid dehalogenase